MVYHVADVMKLAWHLRSSGVGPGIAEMNAPGAAQALGPGRKESLMTGSTWLILLGILVALVSLFADAMGIGGAPSFGWKQTLGLVVGLALVAYGLWRRRR